MSTAPEMPPAHEMRDRYRRELKKDRHCRALSEDGLDALALACGVFARRVADATMARIPASGAAAGIRAALEADGVRVFEKSSPPTWPLLAEYQAAGKTVEMYPDAIRKAEAVLGASDPDFFREATLSEMCLAHEYLHHVDFRMHGRVGGFAAAPVRRFGILRLTRCPETAGEVAAHEFVRLWHNLPFSPIVFHDVVVNAGMSARLKSRIVGSDEEKSAAGLVFGLAAQARKYAESRF